MSQTVDLEVFYPHPRQRVWQVLTSRCALAAWMMENDFEPKLGHRFQFYSQPLLGLKTVIQCEVVELEEPTRLVYTWQESPTAERSLVIWTLTDVAGGTQLRLKHHQYSYSPAVAASTHSAMIRVKRSPKEAIGFPNNAGLYIEPLSIDSGWQMPSRHPSLRSKTQSNAVGRSMTLELPIFQAFTWEYFLNQTLPKMLMQDEPTCN